MFRDLRSHLSSLLRPLWLLLPAGPGEGVVLQVAVGEGLALVVADNWEESWFILVDFMSPLFLSQSWAVLLLGVTLLPLVQQVKHRPAAKLGRAEWFTALQGEFITAVQHIRLEDRHGWFAATALEQVAG